MSKAMIINIITIILALATIITSFIVMNGSIPAWISIILLILTLITNMISKGYNKSKVELTDIEKEMLRRNK